MNGFAPIDETDPVRIRERMRKLEHGGAAAEQLGMTEEADACALEYARLQLILEELESNSNGTPAEG